MTKNNQSKNQTSIAIKLTQEEKANIKRAINKGKFSEYVKIAIFAEISYFPDDFLIKIYKNANYNETTMKEYVLWKMGIIKTPQCVKVNKKNIKNHIIKIRIDQKEELKKVIKKLQIKQVDYITMKTKALLELANLFTFEELIEFKAKARLYELTLEKYIQMRVLAKTAKI